MLAESSTTRVQVRPARPEFEVGLGPIVAEEGDGDPVGSRLRAQLGAGRQSAIPELRCEAEADCIHADGETEDDSLRGDGDVAILRCVGAENLHVAQWCDGTDERVGRVAVCREVAEEGEDTVVDGALQRRWNPLLHSAPLLA